MRYDDRAVDFKPILVTLVTRPTDTLRGRATRNWADVAVVFVGISVRVETCALVIPVAGSVKLVRSRFEVYVDVAGCCKTNSRCVVRGIIDHHFLDGGKKRNIGHRLKAGRSVVDTIDIQRTGRTVEYD